MPETRDPGADIKRLAERLSQEVEKIGLTLRGFSFSPDMNGDGPHMVQAVFAVEGDIEPAPEKSIVDLEFEAMMLADKLATEAAAVTTATATLEALKAELTEPGDEPVEVEVERPATEDDIRARLQARLSEGGGLLEDD